MSISNLERRSIRLDQQMISRGGAVCLARLDAADRVQFLAATRSSRRLHRPWVHPPTTRDAFEEFAVESPESRRERFLLWSSQPAASRSEEDWEPVVLGYFSLGEVVRGNLQSAYLGYWVTAAYAGQGVMSEGMELLLAYVFRGLRLHRVEANIQPGNAASIALARRTGFELEGFSPRYLKVGGRWRDHERWAMTVEQWRARPRLAARPAATRSNPAKRSRR